MRKIILFVIILCCISALSYADENDPINYEIVLRKNDETKVVTHIDFIDKDKKQKGSSFDIKANNPYEDLNFPIRGKNAWDFNDYDLSNQNKAELLARYLPNVPESKQDGYVFWGARSFIDIPVHERGVQGLGSSYLAISYIFEVLKRRGRVLANESTVLVLNPKGEIDFRLDNFPSNCNSPVVTKDGRYLAFRYGGAADASLISVTPPGHRIYDIQKNEVIFNEFLSNEYSDITGPYIKYDRVFFRLHKVEESMYLIYDFATRIRYSISFSRELSRTHLVWPTQEGLVVKKEGVVVKTYSFENDFHKEDF